MVIGLHICFYLGLVKLGPPFEYVRVSCSDSSSLSLPRP